MPIGKEEVLATLNDPILTRINFSVGMLRVCVEMFRMVARYIQDEDIKVVPGRSNRFAFYDRQQNQIETPGAQPAFGFHRSGPTPARMCARHFRHLRRR